MVRERERERRKGTRREGKEKKIDEKEGRKKKHAKLSTAPPRYFLALSKPSLQMLLATTTLHLPRALSSRSPSQHRCNIPSPPPPLSTLTLGVERCRSKLDDPSSNVEETSYPVSFLSSPQLVLNEEKLAIGRSLSLQVTIRDSLLPLRSFKPLAPTFERVVSE